MMRTLDRRISIERKTVIQDPFGQDIETWTAIDANRPAAVLPLNGTERFISDQFISRQQSDFRIRWSADVADLSTLDRIVYPAADSPIAEEQIYDIMDVQELGRRESLRILAARRAE